MYTLLLKQYLIVQNIFSDSNIGFSLLVVALLVLVRQVIQLLPQLLLQIFLFLGEEHKCWHCFILLFLWEGERSSLNIDYVLLGNFQCIT